MAKVKCPVCNGTEIEPIRCGRVFFCPVCDGEGEIEESLLKQKGITAVSYNQSKEEIPNKQSEEEDSDKLPTPGWVTMIMSKKAK